MRVIRLLFAASLFVFPIAGIAQETTDAAAPSTDKKLGKLEGRAVHALTGEPVRKAKLTLGTHGSDSRTLRATTDADGRFTFDNLEPGTYHLTAEKAGFLQQAYGSRNYSELGTPLTVTAGGHISDVAFKMMPQGVITGKVLDEDGEPIPHAMVNILRQGGRGTKPMVVSGESANDLGEFRVADISPGRYYAAIQVFDFHNEGSTSPKKDGPEEALVQTFYPGVTDPAAAVAFEVKPGQEVSGIFITARKSRVYRVSGKVSGLTAAHSPSSISVSLSSRERNGTMMLFAGGFGRLKPDGSFEIANVQPGAYYASIHLQGGGRPQILGRTSVDVADANVTGVVVPLLEPLQIAGTIRIEGDSKISLDAGMVTLVQADLQPGGYRPTRANSDETFKIEGVGPDKYYVNLWNFPETVYLKTVRLGKQESADSGLDLTDAQGTVNVELVFGTKPGTVEGSVREDTKPLAGSSVLLVRDPMIAAQRFGNKSGNTDQNGRFSIKGVAPGSYKLYAWETDPGVELSADPDALKAFESKAVKITVEEGATAHIDLTPLKPEDAQPQ